MSLLKKKELEELKSILNQEIQSYTLVEQKMAKKRELLVQGDISELAKLDQELMVLNQKVDELERGRIALLIHMGHKDKSLKDFIECLDVNNAQPFIEARQRLVRVVENVRELNTESRSLLELSVKWIEDSVSLIAQLLMPEASSYSPVMDKKQNKQQQEAAIIHSTVDHSA